MNIFTEVRSSEQKILGIPFFYVIKSKIEVFLENCGHRNSVLRKTLQKLNFG